MVLEHLFPEDWLERKLRYAFILAFVYSAAGILISRLVFGANSGIASVVFTSILLLPYLQKLFMKEEITELHEKNGFSVKTFLQDNWPAIKVYGSLFFGIYLAYLCYAFFFPTFFGMDLGVVFREQLSRELRTGHAFEVGFFLEILLNNWWVLLACFALAVLTGDGAIFFITWNASTWGVVFGYRALAAAKFGGLKDPFTNLLIIFLITLPHLLIEALAYILAAISGAVLSDDVISESGDTPYFLALVVGIFFAYWILVVLFAQMFSPILQVLFRIGSLILLMRLLSTVFRDASHRNVFGYNYRLFVVAVVILILGALVESFVLMNSSLLANVYSAAFY